MRCGSWGPIWCCVASLCSVASSAQADLAVLVSPIATRDARGLHLQTWTEGAGAHWAWLAAGRDHDGDGRPESLGCLALIARDPSDADGDICLGGINEAGLVFTAAHNGPRVGNLRQPAVAHILGNCQGLDAVYTLLRAGRPAAEGPGGSSEQSGCCGYSDVGGAASILEVVRDAAGKQSAAREYPAAAVDRAELADEFGRRANLRGLLVRPGHALHGQGYHTGRGLIDAWADQSRRSRRGEAGALQYIEAMQRMVVLRDEGLAGVEPLLAPPSGGFGIRRLDPEAQAAMLVHLARPNGREDPRLSTVWVRMGPAGCAMAVPLWVAGVQADEGLRVPEPLQAASGPASLAAHARRLADSEVAIQAAPHLRAFERHVVEQVCGTLLPHWRRQNWSDTAVAAAMAAQMHRVQETIAGDALALARSQTDRQINAPPAVALHAAAFDALTAQLTFTIDDPEDGPLQTGLWDYGDGATGSRPEHTYEAAGTYLVSLTAIDRQGGRQTAWQVIRVEGYPRIRRGDRPIDDLRKPQMRRPRDPVTAGRRAAMAASLEGEDVTVPLLVSASALALLIMGAVATILHARNDRR